MKMQEKYKQLLEALLESAKEFLNSQELGELAGISQRTVIRYMKELKEQSLKYGFFIHTVKGRGYRLEIIEEEKFRDALAVEEDVEVTKVLFKLFFERTCKLDDLAELLHYSRSGMSRIIEKVEKKLEREGLRLLNKPYVGFFIGGSEVYIRNYLYKLLKKKSLEETEKIFRVPREMLAKVRSEIDAELAQKSVHKRKENELFFLKYLLIQKQRIAIGKTIKTDYFANISQTVHLNHDMEVVRNIQKRIETSVCPKSDEEIENIYLALVYRQAFWQNGYVDSINEKNLQFYQDMTERAFQRIKNDYKVDLFQDDILVNGLVLHLASNFSRYLLGMETENLFYNDVLESYPTAYYYAMEVAEEISVWTKLSLSKYEISFLGMHFASYLERSLKSKKWKCAIIYGSGIGSAKLLESRLHNKYPHLEVIGTGLLEEAGKKAEEADFFITTFPVEEPEIMGKPWVRLSPMLDIKEQIALEQLVGNLARHRKWRYESVSKMYLYIDQYMEKIELLNYLCDLCREKRFITEQEAEGIVGRENLVSTEIVEGIAMPHGLIEGSSFLVFALLKEPIIWGRTSVKLVVMGCFQRGDERMKEELEYIFHLFLNLEDKNRLLSCKSAEEIERCMEVYYGK